MSLLALTGQLTPMSVPLASLFLDPNNPRFVDADWAAVPDSEIGATDVQDRTRRRLVTEFAVEKLRMNMEVNGYLPIDRIIVREFSDGQFVVLEGNRRVCAAKLIATQAQKGTAVDSDVLSSLSIIPALQYTGGDAHNAAWIFQGLRHISGVEDWSAFNKAKLLVEQMESEGLSLTEVGRRFGLTPFGAGQWVRGFYAFRQAREESDVLTQVDERSYPYFQELFSRSSAAVRDWLGWDDKEYKFTDLLNFNEFVSWLYPKPEAGDDAEESLLQGDWSRRYLPRRDDIRSVAYLIRADPELFQQFRVSGQLEQAYSQALTRKYEKEARNNADPVEDVFDSISTCTKALDNLPLKVIKDPALKSRLNDLISELESKIELVK